jgi:GAF domain-containing protein
MRQSGLEHEWGQPTDGDTVTATCAAFEHVLRAQGLISALGLLNRRTRFRFTGLYRVAPPELHNISLYDRENPMLRVSGAVTTLCDTYCGIVQESGQPYRVKDALADASLQSHAARGSVQSYAGVPLRLPTGQVLGTLCHFDGRPRITPPGELRMLQAIAPMLLPWLNREVAAPR